MTKILLLEDDPIISKEISTFLNLKGLICDTVFDGDLFLKKIKHDSFDIFLLDINVPKINGLDVCKHIRKENISTPILMLTAFGEIEEKTTAFQLGADDYLVKPFHLEELFLRIKALIRRKNNPQSSVSIIKIDDMEINLDDITVLRNGTPIHLSPKEFKLLTILAKSKGRVLSKQQIADELWDYRIESSQNTIEVYINFLRNKIDKNFTTKLIHTKPGFGYYLKAE